MALENVAKFEELLQCSAELQDRLKVAYKAFPNKKDERAVFDALIAPMAVEAGLPYTFDEGVEVHAGDRELSDAELQAVAGGGTCYIVGGSDGVEVVDRDDLKGDGIGAACEYVGITAGVW